MTGKCVRLFDQHFCPRDKTSENLSQPSLTPPWLNRPVAYNLRRGEERFREEGETAQKIAGGGRKDA